MSIFFALVLLFALSVNGQCPGNGYATTETLCCGGSYSMTGLHCPSNSQASIDFRLSSSDQLEAIYTMDSTNFEYFKSGASFSYVQGASTTSASSCFSTGGPVALSFTTIYVVAVHFPCPILCDFPQLEYTLVCQENDPVGTTGLPLVLIIVPAVVGVTLICFVAVGIYLCKRRRKVATRYQPLLSPVATLAPPPPLLVPVPTPSQAPGVTIINNNVAAPAAPTINFNPVINASSTNTNAINVNQGNDSSQGKTQTG